MVYANPSAFYLGGGLPACHRYSNQVASVFAHQLHGVRLERFCPWQCVFFLYLHPLVPDGTEKDRVEIYRLLCGDRGYTAALYLPPQAIETILSIFTLFIRVMIPVVLFASTFIATTKVSELIAAMYSLKIPRSITITFAMVLRFFPTFSEEIHNIYDAMKLRGIALSWKNVFTRPMLILEAITIPIVMRSVSIAEELSASAVTRGIDNPAQRTSFIQLKVHAKDWMVLCFFLVAFVVLFFCKYQIYGRI